FRECKQQFDFGRCATADIHAAEALGYAALFAHTLIRSLRIATAIGFGLELEKLRPLACLHAVRCFAADIALAAHSDGTQRLQALFEKIVGLIVQCAFEHRTSRSRRRLLESFAGPSG